MAKIGDDPRLQKAFARAGEVILCSDDQIELIRLRHQFEAAKEKYDADMRRVRASSVRLSKAFDKLKRHMEGSK